MGRSLKSLRVLVTPTSFGASNPVLKTELEATVSEVVYNKLGRPLTSQELKSLLPGIDGYIAGLDTIDQSALESADRLKIIARYGVGVDKVDLAAASRRSITVTNTPRANSSSVAELAIGLILALARKIPHASAQVREGSWPRITGLSLVAKVIGLVGFGSIGKEVARRLSGWGCDVLAYDPVPDYATASELRVKMTSFDEVLRQSDFISLHLPVLRGNRPLIDGSVLEQMKKGAFLINTARGELLDEVALVNALRRGQLAGAALDTFIEEPPGPGNELVNLPQVIATPHAGAHTDGAMECMGRQSLDDCIAVLSGRPPAFPVNCAQQ